MARVAQKRANREQAHTVGVVTCGAPRSERSQALVPAAIFLALLLGLYQVLLARQYMDPDGMAYLDMGDRIWRDGWSGAINGYWSPLYPATVGAVLKLVHPPMQYEFVLVHLVNFAIYAFALFAFKFFWDGAMLLRLPNLAESPDDDRRRGAWVLLGYTLFVWASLTLTGLDTVAPDLLVTAFVYLAAGTLLRIQAADRSVRNYVLLGLALGLGYLTKAAMFPLGIVFLGVALLAPGGLRKSAPRILAAAMLFLAISAPWIIALSRMAGHPTFGETATLNYAWQVSGVRQYGHLPPGFNLLHPVHTVYDVPPVYQFSGPVRGSYPFWSDPSYWLAGVKPHFKLGGQVHSLAVNVGHLLTLLGHLVWVAVCLFLFLLGPGMRGLRRSVTRMWVLLLPSIAAVGMYALVHLEGRYVAGFLVMFWAAILLAAAGASAFKVRGILLPLSISMAALLVCSVLVDSTVMTMKRRATGYDGEPDLQAALALRQFGLRAGDDVASIGDTYKAYWLRLDRLTAIAEITREDAPRFWAAGPATQARIIGAFGRTGARAIIAESAPTPNASSGWQQLGATRYYVYQLR